MTLHRHSALSGNNVELGLHIHAAQTALYGHTIQLHGELTQSAQTAKSTSEMVVGNRTLMVNVTTNAQNTAS